MTEERDFVIERCQQLLDAKAMSNIVERLDDMAATGIYPKEVREAAAEIRSLRAERDDYKQAAQVEAGLRREFLANNERLLDALKTIECHSIDHTDACRMAGKARRDLENKP